MSQSIPQIRSDIEATKDQISQTVHDIEERIHDLKDWRVTVQTYPIPSMVTAIVVGFILSGQVKPLLHMIGRGTQSALLATVSGIIVSQLKPKIPILKNQTQENTPDQNDIIERRSESYTQAY
jgi:hypothetical protein